MSLEQQQAFLTDLFSRRGRSGGGHNSIWYLERHGATIIEPTAFEPDASTHRGDYYYNVVTNALYRKIVTRRKPVIVAHWQKVSS